MKQLGNIKERESSGLKIYSRLLSYLIPYTPHFLLSIFGFTVYAASQVAATEWLKRLIDFVSNPIEELRVIGEKILGMENSQWSPISAGYHYFKVFESNIIR